MVTSAISNLGFRWAIRRHPLRSDISHSSMRPLIACPLIEFTRGEFRPVDIWPYASSSERHVSTGGSRANTNASGIVSIRTACGQLPGDYEKSAVFLENCTMFVSINVGELRRQRRYSLSKVV